MATSNLAQARSMGVHCVCPVLQPASNGRPDHLPSRDIFVCANAGTKFKVHGPQIRRRASKGADDACAKKCDCFPRTALLMYAHACNVGCRQRSGEGPHAEGGGVVSAHHERLSSTRSRGPFASRDFEAPAQVKEAQRILRRRKKNSKGSNTNARRRVSKNVLPSRR